MSINEMILNGKRNTILNATLGTAAHFMCMAGMSWKDEVAKLCNTGGELGEWISRWRESELKATSLLLEKRDAAAKDAEALSRVRSLLERWEAESSGDEFKMDEINELKAALEGEEAKR